MEYEDFSAEHFYAGGLLEFACEFVFCIACE